MKKHQMTYLILSLILMLVLFTVQRVTASDTPDPGMVNIPGSFQSELGCGGDWDPACANTALAYDHQDGVWQATFTIPAGGWEYKAALNGSWDENYGLHAALSGANISLFAAADSTVKFYYDHESHWITDNVNSVIATVPGSYQTQLGCPGDWDPACLRSWLEDVDGDGIYTFSTTAILAGNYEAKATLNENWDVNYGAGGVQNGANIPFSVPVTGSTVTFRYNAATHLLEVQVLSPGHDQDNNVEYNGLGHNSQESLYRVPSGAISAGNELTLRFRTYHHDVTGVRVRLWDGAAGAQMILKMELAAEDVSCYDAQQAAETCDFWQASYTPIAPTTLYYRFIVNDGSAAAYYDDDAFQDGGWGEATPELQDTGFVVTVYDPAFNTVEWMQNAVVYQIFPDRFRNGAKSNDLSTKTPRYNYPTDPLDQVLRMNWSALPEGYCRHYINPAEPCTQEPRGRDYFGGDLKGVLQRLDYLRQLGVTVIYFNPVFEAASNHAYDTQDYYKIDSAFGTAKEFDQLVREARRKGIKIVLDGVFNHVSSDSPYFDRYHHFKTVGACESVNSVYRSWFVFTPMSNGPCVGPDGPNTMTYSSWWGFDSLPVLDKANPSVQALFYSGSNPVSSYWLKKGAGGWRLDVMGDTSFPAGFWSGFRQTVKATDPNAIIIGELWKKNDVLGLVRGDEADTTMNYRFRNAIQGFFGKVDNKGFVDDGQSNQPPSRLVSKLNSIREDYPDATYYTLLNLMDSHDTERILWSLTPGESNREEREFNAANLARGKRLLRLAVTLQMTIPGAPTIYYGDEIGLTGSDDPDDRRTFAWNGTGPYGSGGDSGLLAYFTQLTGIRKANPVFRQGELTFLLADDVHSTLAYLMRSQQAGAIVAINRSDQEQWLAVNLQGYLPAAVTLQDALGGLGTISAVDGILSFNLPALSAAILLPTSGQDLVAPDAPSGLLAEEGQGQVGLNWNPVADAVGYIVSRSPVSGGGYVPVAEVAGNAYNDSGLQNGRLVYYIVQAVDAAGNVGEQSQEASALPHSFIGWANLQWPPSMTQVISAVDRSDSAYGQVWIDGATSLPGATPTLWAQLGYGPAGSNPQGDAGWNWVDAEFNTNAGNNDEFMASMLPEAVGTYHYVYRYSTTNGREWLYADQNGPIAAGAMPGNPGVMEVQASGDTLAPSVPQNLAAVSVSPTAINLAWDPVTGDATLYGYEVLRSDLAGGPYTMLARITETTYQDHQVDENAIYFYVVRALDLSFNRSGTSNEVQAAAEMRTVALTFTVSVPSTTPSGAIVYIAGSLDLLDGGLPNWNPGGVALTQIDANTWTVAFTGKEGTQIEYKYTLGSWSNVEKGASCDELSNRVLILNYGANGQQQVNDVVLNWRNAAPCGD